MVHALLHRLLRVGVGTDCFVVGVVVFVVERAAFRKVARYVAATLDRLPIDIPRRGVVLRIPPQIGSRHAVVLEMRVIMQAREGKATLSTIVVVFGYCCRSGWSKKVLILQ